MDSVKDTKAFKTHYMDTISCSHPCLARYNKKGHNEYPINCGYCYPCLIRKSSLIDVKDYKYSFTAESKLFIQQYGETEKASDLRAVISAVYNYRKMVDGDIIKKIKIVGNLSSDEVSKFLDLYKSTMNDLEVLFSEDEEMIGD